MDFLKLGGDEIQKLENFKRRNGSNMVAGITGLIDPPLPQQQLGIDHVHFLAEAIRDLALWSYIS